MSCLGPVNATTRQLHDQLADIAVQSIARSSPALAALYSEFPDMRDKLWSVWTAEIDFSVSEDARQHVKQERLFWRKNMVRHHEPHGRALTSGF